MPNECLHSSESKGGIFVSILPRCCPHTASTSRMSVSTPRPNQKGASSQPSIPPRRYPPHKTTSSQILWACSY
jgi:hypothetical protein